MKYIEVDEELYRYIAGKTERIGESASDILRRLLGLEVAMNEVVRPDAVSEPSLDANEKAENQNISDATEIDFKSLINQSEIELQKGAVGRFMFALSSLQQRLPEQFSKVLEIQGRGRLYFATSKEALLKASKSANPKQIGDSQYWVTTNNNTAKKRTLFAEALILLGCETELAHKISEKI